MLITLLVNQEIVIERLVSTVLGVGSIISNTVDGVPDFKEYTSHGKKQGINIDK